MAASAEEDMTSLLGEFCVPTLEDVDSQSLLSQSQYAMVVFHDVAETYPLDSDVLCRFTLTSGIQRSEDDTITVMRVGWSKPDESIVSHPVPQPLTPEQKEFELVFKAGELPRDSEFYQLCYLSKGEVRGASVPFQFRRAATEELLVLECGDMAVVRSQPAVAEDMKLQIAGLRHKLTKAQSDLINAQEEARLAEEHSTKLTQDHLKVKIDLESELKFAKELTRTQMEKILEQKAALEEELNTIQEKMKKFEQEVHVEKEFTQYRMSIADERVRTLEEGNINLSKRLEEVRQLERVMAQARVQSQAVQEDRDKTHEALQLAEVRIVSLSDHVTILQAENERMGKALHSKALTHDLVAATQQEVQRQKEMLDAVQDAKELATREMITAVQGKEKAQNELLLAMEDMLKLKSVLKEERDNSKRQVQILEDEWRNEKEQLLAELTRLASLQSRDASTMKPALERALNQLNESQELVKDLETQVANLTAKLTDIEEKHRILQEQHKELQLKELQQRQQLTEQQQQLEQQQEQQQQQQQQEQQQQPKEKSEMYTMSFSQERAKAAAGVRTLTGRLRVIQEREKQVRNEEETVREELLHLNKFLEELQLAAQELEYSADDLKRRYEEAHDLCEATQATLCERDMNIAIENLSEKRACLESASLRQNDLTLRQQELKEERTVLALQTAQATKSLCTLASMLALEEAEPVDFASGEASGEPQVQPEVSDLRARLQKAAEAYQELYREKMTLERRVTHLKKMLHNVQKQKTKGPVTVAGGESSEEEQASGPSCSAMSSTSAEQPRESDTTTGLGPCQFCSELFPIGNLELYHPQCRIHLI